MDDWNLFVSDNNYNIVWIYNAQNLFLQGMVNDVGLHLMLGNTMHVVYN